MIVPTPTTRQRSAVPVERTRTRARLLSPTSSPALDGTRAPFAGAVPAVVGLPSLVAAPPPRGAPV